MCPGPGRDGSLPSAARHGGVQARALGDAQLGHFLSAGGVDAHRPHHLRIGGPTPTRRGRGESGSAGRHVHITLSPGRWHKGEGLGSLGLLTVPHSCTLSPPASSQEHLPTPVGLIPSPSREMPGACTGHAAPPLARLLPAPSLICSSLASCCSQPPRHSSTWVVAPAGPSVRPPSSLCPSPLLMAVPCTRRHPTPNLFCSAPSTCHTCGPCVLSSDRPPCTAQSLGAQCRWTLHREPPSFADKAATSSSSYICAHMCWNIYPVGRFPPRTTSVYISNVDRRPSRAGPAPPPDCV